MKIVIDIPEEVYKDFMDDWIRSPEILSAVRKGVPISTQGDLVDIDKSYDTVFHPRNGILEIYKDRSRAQLENALEDAFDQTLIVLGGSNDGK